MSPLGAPWTSAAFAAEVGPAVAAATAMVSRESVRLISGVLRPGCAVQPRRARLRVTVCCEMRLAETASRAFAIARTRMLFRLSARRRARVMRTLTVAVRATAIAKRGLPRVLALPRRVLVTLSVPEQRRFALIGQPTRRDA